MQFSLSFSILEFWVQAKFVDFKESTTQYAEWDLNKISKTIAETLIALFLMA